MGHMGQGPCGRLSTVGCCTFKGVPSPGRALVEHEKSVGDCVEGRGYYYSQTFYPMYIDVREFVFVFVSLFEFAFLFLFLFGKA